MTPATLAKLASLSSNLSSRTPTGESARRDGQQVRYQMLHCFLEDGKLNIVIQFTPNSTLHSRLPRSTLTALRRESVEIFIQALLGLRHMHSKKIIHRDIKSLNLFFDMDDNVLVGDLACQSS